MANAAATNCAIDFAPGGFVLDKKRILGRMSAGKGFLSGFLRHSHVDTFYCVAQRLEHFSQFTRITSELGASGTPARWIPHYEVGRIAEAGCIYHPDPRLSDLAWQRRFAGQRSYSVCGVNHTICSEMSMSAIGSLLISPLQSWDALICTSQASKAAIEHMLHQWGDYLASRLNAQPQYPLQLPVIPLGVDCDAFGKKARPRESRKRIRDRFQIGPNDVAVLYAGRLTYHVKAHPLPMYLALEAAARRTGKRVHLIEAGWFPNRQFENEFKDAARQWCPSVPIHFVDGRGPDMSAVWHAADLFTSLPDNIQETFGLTPIEAMAAGLPQVISDWDGYRDTVRHGVDGFRVSTVMPRPGAGREMIRRHFFNRDRYHEYCGSAGQATAVDVPQSVEAFVQLIGNPELRASMGETARARARECFDWAVVIAAYQELWGELRQRREQAEESVVQSERSSPHPLREDPFAVFSSYPTVTLDLDKVVCLSSNRDPAHLDLMLDTPMMSFAEPVLASADERSLVLDRLGQGACQVAELLEHFPPHRHDAIVCTLGWLIKADLACIEGLQPLAVPATAQPI